MPARFGGEEFAVLLRNPSPTIAVEVGERVRSAVASLDLRRLGVPGVSVSVGVAVADEPDVPIDDVDREADRRSTGPSARAATGSSPRRPAQPMPSRTMPRRVARPTCQPSPTRPSPTCSTPASTPTRPTEDAGERRPPTNGDLARIFHEIGDILEVQGEIKFKTVAYHRAADTIARGPFDVAAAYAAGDRRPIPGVGQAIGDKIVELATTGHMGAYERLHAEIPASLVDLLRIPGVGPQTVRIVYEGLGVEIARGPAPGRRGRHAPRPEGHLGQHRTADP